MNVDFYKQAGARIRQQREYLNMTREQLSDKADISIQFLAAIEQGRKGFTVETMKKLCEALHISADKIILNRDNPTDVQKIIQLLEIIDSKYIPLAGELIKVFINTLSVK